MLIDKKRVIFFHGVDHVRFAERFGIEPCTAPCTDCCAPRTTTVPFACGEFRGLMAPPCIVCGHEGTPYCLVRDPKHGDLFSSK